MGWAVQDRLSLRSAIEREAGAGDEVGATGADEESPGRAEDGAGGAGN